MAWDYGATHHHSFEHEPVMNRPTLFLAIALPLSVSAGLAVISNRRISRLEASLGRTEEAIVRLEAEARKGANFRTIMDAINNPPPGFNQMPLPPPPTVAAPAARLLPPPTEQPAGFIPGSSPTIPPASSQELVKKFLHGAKISTQQWDAVQKANVDAKNATTVLSRELPDDIDPAIVESKLKEIDERRQRALDSHLAGAQRQAYEEFRASTEMDSMVSLAGGRVRRFFPKY